MPLIPAPPAPPDKDTLPLRLERGLHAQLRDYAEFLGSTKEYIVSAALRRIFRHDRDFVAWQQTRQVVTTSVTPATSVPPAAETTPDTARFGAPESVRRPTGKDRA